MTAPGSGDGVDLARLADWMTAAGLGTGPLTEVRRLTGGTQNVLLGFRRGDRAYVLRRPPLHKRANSDETMRREARVLAALSGSPVPHPGLIAACGDETVLGAAFYLMEPVDGANPTADLPPWGADPAARHAFGLSMADALAAVGALDHEAVGLGGLGRADGWLERQVGRWAGQLASYAQVPAYGSRPRLDGTIEIETWLDAHLPRSWSPGLLHGDFHLANVVADRVEPRVAAVVDWELATVGDPLVDLGWLLSSWPESGGVDLWSGAAITTGGLPTRAEMLARYADRSHRGLEEIRWYEVLACFKIGIIFEGTHARALAGQAPAETGDLLHRNARLLLRQAHERMDTT